jgi:hypothetical protein
MKPCTGCRHLVVMDSGGGVCRWPERHGKWTIHTDPLTGSGYRTFTHDDGDVEKYAVWRPDVEIMRGVRRAFGPDVRHFDKCGAEARLYEPTLWRRLFTRNP